MSTKEQRKQRREYMKKWRKTPKGKKCVQIFQKEYRRTHKKEIKKGRSHHANISRFDGNRFKVLERDKYTCQKCSKTHHDVRLVVHHIDENKKNNKMNNLITLCLSCHTSLHQKGKPKKRRKDV